MNRALSTRVAAWNWKGTSLPPSEVEVCEREAEGGDGLAVAAGESGNPLLSYSWLPKR